MNRHPDIFNVGDYIGDINNTCRKVDAVTAKDYTITYIPENISKTISREKKPSIYWGQDTETNYAENYYLLRSCGHKDITNFPIGSEQRYTEENGLNNPKENTVIIIDYAFSEGVFWVCNSERKSSGLFIAYKENLREK